MRKPSDRPRALDAPVRYSSHRILSKEDMEKKAREDDLICRKLDSLASPSTGARYALMRSRVEDAKKPHAVVYVREGEDPGEVARFLGSEILELSDDCLEETSDRLQKEMDRLNSVTEVMNT